MAGPSPPTPTGASSASTAASPPQAPAASAPEPPSGGPTPTSGPKVDPSLIVQNDPARTGFDPKTALWVSYFKMLSGQMSDEGKFHFREWRYQVKEKDDCQRCERDRDWLFAYSPTVRFMRERVAALNGNLDASNVLCRRCPARLTPDGRVWQQGGGFSPQHGILVCANQIRNRGHLEDVLAHEMVHAWDHLRWKVDFAGDKNLKHAACTEIRASMLSGECRWSREAFLYNNWSLTQQFQKCVRRRAILSVSGRPQCKDLEQATKAVNQVWDSCFADTRPFDEVYR